MQEASMHKVEQLYLGPAPHGDRKGEKYWHRHPSDYRNPGIIVTPLPRDRINIDFEVRNQSDHVAEHINISLFVVEFNLTNIDHERASRLLRNVVTNRAPLEEWTNQSIPPCSSDGGSAWRIPKGPIQAKISDGSFVGNFVVVVLVAKEGVGFFQSLDHRDFDLSTVPQAGVWSSTLPEKS